LWWCPAGPLARLPITAAGRHREASGRTVLDRVVSSTTPTLAALAQALTAPPAGRAGALVVAVPQTPRLPPLPHAAAEAEAVWKLLPGARVLVGEAADLSTVEDAIRTARIVHFAGHGDSDTRMSVVRGGGLHLADGVTLTASQLQGIRLDPGDLAFLSACDTARPHPGLPDEPLHVAAAFQLAGFRSVIGTLWTAPDSVEVARAVYTDLTSGGRRDADTARSAPALAAAMRGLRDRFPAVPTRWAGYLHVGA
jgi:CHAT domain-containing protein